MKIVLNKNVDMLALGDWLVANVGPIWMRIGISNVTPTRPIYTPLSRGRRWVIEYDFDKKRQVLELDGRKLKPHASILRTELLLRFS
jgi:hypothetical protein